MERAVMLVQITKTDCWYKKGQIHLVFIVPKVWLDTPAYRVVGYNGLISIKDCVYLNEDPFNYENNGSPENGLTLKEDLLI